MNTSTILTAAEILNGDKFRGTHDEAVQAVIRSSFVDTPSFRAGRKRNGRGAGQG